MTGFNDWDPEEDPYDDFDILDEEEEDLYDWDPIEILYCLECHTPLLSSEVNFCHPCAVELELEEQDEY